MSELDQREDAELLAAPDDGGQAFAIFYRRHVEAVLRLCARRGLDAQEAADVTAETFAAALLARGRYRPTLGPARAWLLGIAAHKVADHGRRRARDRQALRRLAVDVVCPSERDVADYADLVIQETTSVAIDALDELPEAQRAAVSARVINGASYGDIARTLQIDERVARQRVSRGLSALRLRLGKEQP